MRERHRNFEGRIERPLLLVDEALDTNFASAVVRHSQRILSEMGRDPSPCGVPFGSDASKLSRAGIPAVVFGPGSINQAHAVDDGRFDVERVKAALPADCGQVVVKFVQ